ncbi:hypothetical protein ACHMW7_18725 [Aminobacter sp. UC22_36]|uniref:hypothetical protein n=1 Tax=Aminobacter sp. UC22_36 TaxID=3374549 RepID=UPI003757B151
MIANPPFAMGADDKDRLDNCEQCVGVGAIHVQAAFTSAVFITVELANGFLLDNAVQFIAKCVKHLPLSLGFKRNVSERDMNDNCLFFSHRL